MLVGSAMAFSIVRVAVGCHLEETPENVSQSGNGSLYANYNHQDDAGHEKKYHLRNNSQHTRLNIITSFHNLRFNSTQCCNCYILTSPSKPFLRKENREENKQRVPRVLPRYADNLYVTTPKSVCIERLPSAFS